MNTMLKKARRYAAIAIMLAGHGFCSDIHAHPGGLNAEGCHKNRKTGQYYCHNPKKNIEPTTTVTVAKEAVIGIAAIETVKKESGLLRLDYEGFTIWMDCSKRGPVKFQYNAQRDTGNAKRDAYFYLDPNVPKECQQLTSKAYGHGYDRGHQTLANHLDASDMAIRQTNYMTNILPQTSQMNRGAWLGTEEIIECYRT
jgi:endonuclease G